LIQWLKQILGSNSRATSTGSQRRAYVARSPRAVNAKYDAAQTTPENRRHWMMADHLSADAAANPQVRRVLRSRARYEVANNGYARGMLTTLANYVVGTGPRLQMLTDDDEANRVIEREFARWAKAIGLAHKLWTMRMAQAESGEVFGILATNPRIDSPVQLDLRLIEADQVTAPSTGNPIQVGTDGILRDDFGNPIAYFVLKHHPGDATGFRAGSEAFDLIPAEAVIHLFRAQRPGQGRGIPEITSSLSLYAMLRRYTLAVLGSAEQAALPSGVIYSDAPAGIMPAIALVPTSLSAMGTTLWKSLEIRDTSSGGASTKYPVANPHVGKFRVEVSRYLANSSYTGNSDKAWYLLAEPNDLAVIEVAFLNGQESPTIETAEADFNVLGIQMRGYHDFGVALQEPRGGIKAKGEA